MTNGVILLPTLNRINLLKQFVNSYIATKAQTDLWILIDAKDREENETGYNEVKSLSPHILLVDTGDAVTMGDKCRFVWPMIQEYRWVGLLNDDHFCVTEGWDVIADKMLNGKNMISTNDGFWNFGFRMCGLTAWSMDLLRKAEIPIYPKGLKHLFIDDLWKAIGESSGCWQETMKINIEHRHVFRGLMEPDQTFNQSNNQQKYLEEGKVFEAFMNAHFKETVEKIVFERAPLAQEAKFN